MIDEIIVSLEAATNEASSPRAAHASIMWYCRVARTAAMMPKIATSASFNRRAERGRGMESRLKTNDRARIAATCRLPRDVAAGQGVAKLDQGQGGREEEDGRAGGP